MYRINHHFIPAVFLLICTAVSASLFSSCQKEEPITPYLQLSVPAANELYVRPGGEFEFSFEVSGVYSGHLMIDGASAGISDFQVFGSNLLTSVRVSGVYGGGEAWFTVKVKAGSEAMTELRADIVASRAELTGLPGEGGFIGGGPEETVTLGLSTNLPEGMRGGLSVRSDADWAVPAVSGETVTVTLSENGSHRPRTCVLTLHDAGGLINDIQYAVTQDWETSLEPCRPGVVGFADKAFKSALLDIADADGDGEISLEEAEAVHEIDISGRGVKDLTGLEAFRNLEVFDGHDNGIVNADVFSRLRYLRWFNIKGNPDLESFDLTGCTIYFDRCLFDTSEKLHYKTLLRQLNVTFECDPYSTCAEHIVDTRTSTDWSHHKNMIQIHKHTTGDGKKAVVLSGLGWLDVDIEDGSFHRGMRDMLDFLYYKHPNIYTHKDELDIYIMEYVSESRERFVFPPDDHLEDYAKELQDKYIEWQYSHHSSAMAALYPDYDGVVLSANMDLHPNVKQYPLRTSGYPGIAITSRPELHNMFLYKFNLSVALDKDTMGCYARRDDTFENRKQYEFNTYTRQINELFGWQ